MSACTCLALLCVCVCLCHSVQIEASNHAPWVQLPCLSCSKGRLGQMDGPGSTLILAAFKAFKASIASYLQAIRAMRGWGVEKPEWEKRTAAQYDKYTLWQIKEVALGHMCEYQHRDVWNVSKERQHTFTRAHTSRCNSSMFCNFNNPCAVILNSSAIYGVQ